MLTYKIFILIVMILLHIIEDFHLRGILANMKQKKWWEIELVKANQYSEKNWKKYKNDYIISLIIHSLENSIFIVLPIIIDQLIYTFTTNPNNSYFLMWIAYILFNTIAHSYIDDLKCNKLKINLVTDQLLHFIIIILLFIGCWNDLGMWM